MKKHLLLLAALLMIVAGAKAQSLTATPNVINHLDYIEPGPSGVSCYILVSQELEGELVIVTAPEQFEISLNGDDFLSSLQIQLVEDSLLVNQQVPIFVRLMAGLDEGVYDGTILHECGEASVEVQVSGTVEDGLYNVYLDCNIEELVTVNTVTAHVNDTIIISIEEDEYYELDTIWGYHFDDPTQIVLVENNAFIMPACNVMVKAMFVHKQATIDSIARPNPICAGEPPVLEIPNYDFPSDAIDTRWQLSNQEDFDEHIIVYEMGQPLDVSFNEWWLRFKVSYEWGESFSNAVQITINGMDNLSIIGDTDPCSNQEIEYHISDAENYSINWQVSDTTATVTVESNRIKVLWTTAGQHSLSATVTNLLTGCSTQVETNVTVDSYIDSSTLNEIVQKDCCNLVYRNPNYFHKYQWYKNGEIIEGANWPYYWQVGGLDNGTYKVYVSSFEDEDGNLICGAFSHEIIVDNTISTVSMSVYPNPACVGESVFIVNNDKEESQLTICALDGRLIHKQIIADEETTLNLRLSKGIYVARLINSKGEKIEKIVIQ